MYFKTTSWELPFYFMLYQFSKLIRSEYQISLVRKLSLVPTVLAQQNLLRRPLVRDVLDTLVPT